MPTLAAHSIWDNHYEAFLRPHDGSPGGYHVSGSIERVAQNIATLLWRSDVRADGLAFSDRYGNPHDQRAFDCVLREMRNQARTEEPFGSK